MPCDCRRPNCVEKLGIAAAQSIIVDDDEGTLDMVQTMLTVIATQSSSLRWLSIQAPALGLAGPQVAALATFTQLTYLEVSTSSCLELLRTYNMVARDVHEFCSKVLCIAPCMADGFRCI